jgi:hypothetical protein
MADNVSLTVQLVDKVSGPANKAAASVNKLTGQAYKFNKAGKLIDANTGRFLKFKGSVNDASMGLDDIHDRLGAAGGGFAALVKKAMAFQAVVGVFNAFKSIIVGTVKLAYRFGSALIRTAITAEALEFGIAKFLKSADKGKKAFQDLISISNKTGISIENAATTFRGFISAGKSVPFAKQMVRWRADLESLATTPQEIERVQNAFVQLEKAIVTGRFEADGFMSILAGIPGADKLNVIRRVATLTGKSFDELKKDITKLPLDATIQAFKELFKENLKLTRLGELAERKQFETFGGAVKALKNRFRNLAFEIGSKLAPVLRDEVLPILKDFQKSLDTPAGKKMIEGLVAKFKVFIKAAAVFGRGLVGMFKGIIQGLGAGLGVTTEGIKKMSEADIQKVIAEMTKLGQAIGKALANLIKLVEWMAKVDLGKMGGTGGMAVEPGGLMGIDPKMLQANLAATTTSLGGAMSKGLAGGISSGRSSVVAAMVATAMAAINAAKRALGIASPSKVFAYMGKMSALGYADGMASVDAMPSLQGSARLGVPMGGAPVINQSNVFETSVNEAASAAATASEIKKQQLLQMASAFERAALELGVAVQ